MNTWKDYCTFAPPIGLCLTISFLPKHIKVLFHTMGTLHHPAHFVLFFAMTCFFNRHRFTRSVPLRTGVGLCVLAIGIELFQRALHGGKLEVVDIADDIAGVLLPGAFTVIAMWLDRDFKRMYEVVRLKEEIYQSTNGTQLVSQNPNHNV